MQTPPIMIASRPVDGSTSSATTCGTIVWVRNANRNLMHQEAVDLHNPNPTHQNAKAKAKATGPVRAEHSIDHQERTLQRARAEQAGQVETIWSLVWQNEGRKRGGNM